MVVALLAGIALVGWIFWSQIQPPRVRVGATGVEVDTLFYGRSVPASDIVGISLEKALPRVLWKSNGFAGAGTRRGRFQVEGLGEGYLYVEDGFAPYLVRAPAAGLRRSSTSASRSGRERSSRRWRARGPIASTANPRRVAAPVRR